MSRGRRRLIGGSGSGSPDVTAPTITSANAVSILEGYALSHTLTADEAVTWTKTGGADQALFTLAGSNLSMTAKDFDIPVDAGANNTYIVEVTATDAALNATPQTITVTVTDLLAETEALLARFSVPPVAARATLYNTVMGLLKVGGVNGSNLLAGLDEWHTPATHDEQAGQRNWVGDFGNLTPVNSPTWTVDRGYAGDGISQHVLWNVNFNDGGQYTQDSASLFCWETAEANTASMSIGAVPNITNMFLRGRNAGSMEGRINDAATLAQVQASSQGFSLINRSASNAKQLSRNGGVDATSATASSATGLTAAVAYLRNNATYRAGRIGLGGKGRGWTANEKVDLAFAAQAWATGVGM